MIVIIVRVCVVIHNLRKIEQSAAALWTKLTLSNMASDCCLEPKNVNFGQRILAIAVIYFSV